ncbi:MULTISPECIES: hypothetical protein [unclassified Luteibacter]|uniref:hypothetical protein n=1 Tax=Luteibacter sp. PvP019 TaxID=3156436 RepID=UPI0033980B0E
MSKPGTGVVVALCAWALLDALTLDLAVSVVLAQHGRRALRCDFVLPFASLWQGNILIGINGRRAKYPYDELTITSKLGTKTMERCFVIQPFDGGDFDARYDQVLAPAILAADLEPYRVDRDPGASIPIQEIEDQIRGARICLADITMDNPNVWFELGFAFAADRPVVMICSEQRPTKYPFDVQHRNILKYRTGTPQDFKNLEVKITERVNALLSKEITLRDAANGLSKLTKIEGIEHHEMVALATIGENIYSLHDKVSLYVIRKDMEKAGFTPFAAALAAKALVNHGLISQVEELDRDGDQVTVYSFTESGWDWLMANKSKFSLRKPDKADRIFGDIPF